MYDDDDDYAAVAVDDEGSDGVDGDGDIYGRGNGKWKMANLGDE